MPLNKSILSQFIFNSSQTYTKGPNPTGQATKLDITYVVLSQRSVSFTAGSDPKPTLISKSDNFIDPQ